MSLFAAFNKVANNLPKGGPPVPIDEPVLPPNPYRNARTSRSPPHIIPYIHGEVEPAHFSFHCIPYKRSDGKEIYVYGQRPNRNFVNSNMPVEWYRSMEELLDHPGEYSWILFTNGFIAARTLTPAEIMSKHKNLHRSNPSPILAAGECVVGPGRTVVYNFLSGTFMRPIIDNFKYAFYDADYRPTYREHIEPMWHAAGATSITYTDNDLLKKYMNDSTPFGRYTKLGYSFQQFDTKKECDAFLEKNTANRGGRRTRRRRNSKTRRVNRKKRFN
jgi:hypothetical protein